MDRFLERDSMEYRRSDPVRKSSVGGEKSKIAVVSAIAFLLIGSFSFAGLYYEVNFISPPSLVATIQGNATNPHANITFGSTMVTTGLWNLARGIGNTTMQIFTNSSIRIQSDYLSVGINSTGNPVGYPSIHFFKQEGVTTQNLEKENYQMFVSFSVSHSANNLSLDVMSDIWLSSSPTVNTRSLEIMVMLYNDGVPLAPAVAQFSMQTVLNGSAQNISWDLYGIYNPYVERLMYFAVPNITKSGNISVLLPISVLLTEIQSVTKTNLSSLYVSNIDIGSEFWNYIHGSIYISSTGTVDNSIWITSYLLVVGQKETITGGS